MRCVVVTTVSRSGYVINQMCECVLTVTTLCVMNLMLKTGLDDVENRRRFGVGET